MPGAQQQIDYFTGPAPCDNCRFRARCGTERLACHRFQMFVDGAGASRWCHAPCAPSHSWYLTAFHRKNGRPRKRHAMAENGERVKGRPEKESHNATLSQLGLDKHEASRFQQIAAVPTTPSGRV